MHAMVLVLTASILVACASSGTRIDPATVATFEWGRTTATEVQARLGPPNGITNLSDGTRILTYAYARYQTRPETFIPIAGAFIGGADSQVQSATFTFGPDGLLRSNTSSQMQIGTGMGGGSSGVRIGPDPR